MSFKIYQNPLDRSLTTTLSLSYFISNLIPKTSISRTVVPINKKTEFNADNKIKFNYDIDANAPRKIGEINDNKINYISHLNNYFDPRIKKETAEFKSGNTNTKSIIPLQPLQKSQGENVDFDPSQSLFRNFETGSDKVSNTSPIVGVSKAQQPTPEKGNNQNVINFLKGSQPATSDMVPMLSAQNNNSTDKNKLFATFQPSLLNLNTAVSDAAQRGEEDRKAFELEKENLTEGEKRLLDKYTSRGLSEREAMAKVKSRPYTHDTEEGGDLAYKAGKAIKDSNVKIADIIHGGLAYAAFRRPVANVQPLESQAGRVFISKVLGERDYLDTARTSSFNEAIARSNPQSKSSNPLLALLDTQGRNLKQMSAGLNLASESADFKRAEQERVNRETNEASGANVAGLNMNIEAKNKNAELAFNAARENAAIQAKRWSELFSNVGKMTDRITTRGMYEGNKSLERDKILAANQSYNSDKIANINDQISQRELLKANPKTSAEEKVVLDAQIKDLNENKAALEKKNTTVATKNQGFLKGLGLA